MADIKVKGASYEHFMGDRGGAYSIHGMMEWKWGLPNPD